MPVANRRRHQHAVTLSSERRLDTRYPLALEMYYTVNEGSRLAERGVTRTIDLSSSEVRFIAANLLATGMLVEIAIDWPVRLDGSIALQLIVTGHIIRTCGKETVVALQKHAFKTRRTGGKLVPIR
jgi:hypothetical protein